MAKITRIKASDTSSKGIDSDTPNLTRKKVVLKDKKADKKKREKIKKIEKSIDKKNEKKHFILFRPFIALFRYIRDAWAEIRQVRWPNAKTTWKMVLAVIIYTALIVVIITLLDMFFSWLFNLILGKG